MSLDSAFAHNWHPCSQMKDYESFPWMQITHAKDSTLYLKNGQKVIDAISSWWCKSLGHGNEELKAILNNQASLFEHVIFANTTSDLAIEFGQKLTSLTKSLKKCFYAGDGSSAIEIALKLSLQYHHQVGNIHKTKFAYLKNAYHGETSLCYSVSDLGLYKDKFKSILLNNYRIADFSYIQGQYPDTQFPKETNWEIIEHSLNQQKHTLAAIIVEPIVQGASGMLLYKPDLLKKLRVWCQDNHIHLIADEIMTGLGRIGNVFACDYAEIEPDFLCLMKSLSAGWIPFSVILTSDNIYSAFYDDYNTGKAFMHSNTFTGNALGMAISNKVLDIYQENNYYEINKKRGQDLWRILNGIREKTGRLTNLRQIGMIAAAEFCDKNGKPFPLQARKGYEMYKEAISYGALIRPLGNTVYILPPYNISDADLEIVEQALHKAINKILAK